MYKRSTNDWPHFRIQNQKRGIACPQPPSPGRGRKVRGVQMKRVVYNRVQTKYKRLSPFLNPKSEKGGLATCTSSIFSYWVRVHDIGRMDMQATMTTITATAIIALQLNTCKCVGMGGIPSLCLHFHQGLHKMPRGFLKGNFWYISLHGSDQLRIFLAGFRRKPSY